MEKSNNVEVKRGQTISFRIPSDTPDYLLKHLQRLKENERRNFSSKIADFVMEGVGRSSKKERESITIPLPKRLSKSQQDWLKHEHSEALLGSILFQLLSNPVRATSLLVSLNSSDVNDNYTLYSQEEMQESIKYEDHQNSEATELAIKVEANEMDDDLLSFDWETASQNTKGQLNEKEGEKDEDLEDLLGDFLNTMNS
ncbi:MULTISPECIES: hypothetical protein [Sutcliffiella]|uniref:Uncharacterized protein n=1 Tax=Sutcliffiella cohnii TaxID=33932 RepID=A0A223KWS4_9BACI|nr:MULTISPECIES: hypothetical protein [Sutcliffiella]AST93902.1 hypothetical protein BC6307_22795 [Sutcliffiella cohnii]WBL15090.1 hypothetical protein O1A01_25035 [Sutcliffiella sp. NC1]